MDELEEERPIVFPLIPAVPCGCCNNDNNQSFPPKKPNVDGPQDTLPPERVDHKLDVPPGTLKQTNITNLQSSSFDGFEPIHRVGPRPPTTDLASSYDAALFEPEGWMGGFG